MKHLTLQIRATELKFGNLLVSNFLTSTAAAAYGKQNIFKLGEKNLQPCNLHLYLSSTLHQILRLSLFQICLYLPVGLPAPGAAPSQLKVETAAHTQRSVFVFLPPTEPSGLDLTILIFSFASDPAVLSKLH